MIIMVRYGDLDVQKQLKGHVDFESAYVIESYPYGRERTQVRVWIETKLTGKKTKGDQRYMFCSLNPKTNKWNKPRTNTYHRIVSMFLDSNGHVQSVGISESCGFESFQNYVNLFDISEAQKINLIFCLKIAMHSAVRWGDQSVEEAGEKFQESLKLITYYAEDKPTPKAEPEPLVRGEGIYIDELNGRGLKKALGLHKARKRYSNKHVDGSGNFGFTLRRTSEMGDFFDLSGDYDTNGKLYSLTIAYKWRNFGKVPLDEINSYQKLTDFLKIALTPMQEVLA